MRKRPWPLSILSLLMLLMGFFHIYTAIQILKNNFLAGIIANNLLPIYLLCKSTFWGLWALLLSWGIWKGKKWAKTTAIFFGLFYSLFFWIDLIWIAEPQTLQDRWLINLVFTVIGLSGLIFAINQKSSRTFFS